MTQGPQSADRETPALVPQAVVKRALVRDESIRSVDLAIGYEHVAWRRRDRHLPSCSSGYLPIPATGGCLCPTVVTSAFGSTWPVLGRAAASCPIAFGATRCRAPSVPMLRLEPSDRSGAIGIRPGQQSEIPRSDARRLPHRPEAALRRTVPPAQPSGTLARADASGRSDARPSSTSKARPLRSMTPRSSRGTSPSCARRLGSSKPRVAATEALGAEQSCKSGGATGLYAG
jgi:hypothetical protein